MNLHLLQRNPDQWKNVQASKKIGTTTPAVQPENPSGRATTDAQTKETETEQADNKRKRKDRPVDEIDQLFEAKLGKKVKKAELSNAPAKVDQDSEEHAKKEKKKHRKDKGEAADKGLDAVLGAIKAAPKEEKRHHKKKTT